MYTSVLVAALLGGMTPGALQDEGWKTDYGLAKKEGRSDSRPLAVFLGKGEQGYEQLSQNGKLPAKVREVLKANYVPLFIDTTKPEGQRLAAKFEMPGGVGLVLSDRSIEFQAFRHEGNLSDANLETYLRRYAAKDYVYNRTESNPGDERVSYYPPSSGAVMTTVAPAYPAGNVYAPGAVYAPGPIYTPTFAPAYYGGGSSCPNCRR